MNQRYETCIIGGGAAGLAAAASIDRRIRTCILEKNEILGRKILATGGGRCNLTNAGCGGVGATLGFFASHGLETICDDEGRYYPYSGCAADVVKVLEDAVREKECHVLTECAVESVEWTGCRLMETAGAGGSTATADAGKPAGNAGEEIADPGSDSFVIRTAKGDVIQAKTVLLASGGKAAPQFGTVGDGYRLARSLGHQVSRLYPILTGIECGDLTELHGIRARGRVTLMKDEREIAGETGEIQFLKDGLSGICVFNLTPYIHTEDSEKPAEAFARYRLVLDLAPDFTQEQIDARDSTFGILNERLSARIGKDQIKGWSLPVLGIKGWKNAQCTAGGVCLDEIDMMSMESKLVPGLYFAGEILNIQGPCGGYNLQNAWETGMRAAAAINKVLAPEGNR